MQTRQLKWEQLDDDVWKASWYQIHESNPGTVQPDGLYKAWFCLFGKPYYQLYGAGSVEDLKIACQGFDDTMRIMISKEGAPQ